MRVREIKDIEKRLVDLGLKPHNAATELCRRAKVDATTYRRWRHGETSPNTDNWDKVLRALAKIEKDAANGKRVLAKRRRRKARKARR